MRCPECGADNPDFNVNFCSACGVRLAAEESERPAGEFQPYFVHSILVLVLCCVPFGIVALINSTKAKSQYEIGNYREAEESAAQAKKWCIYGAVSGVVFSILYAILMIIVD